MSRNTLIFVGIAVVVIIVLFVGFGGGISDGTAPAVETQVPQQQVN